MWEAGLRHHERSADVDRLQQVEARDRESRDVGEAERARVVDAEIDPAEALRGARDGVGNARLVADVSDDREHVGAQRAQLLRCVIDRPGQLRVRGVGFRDQRDIGTRTRERPSDLEADAAAGAADERGTPRHGVSGAHAVSPSSRCTISNCAFIA